MVLFDFRIRVPHALKKKALSPLQTSVTTNSSTANVHVLGSFSQLILSFYFDAQNLQRSANSAKMQENPFLSEKFHLAGRRLTIGLISSGKTPLSLIQSKLIRLRTLPPPRGPHPNGTNPHPPQKLKRSVPSLFNWLLRNVFPVCITSTESTPPMAQRWPNVHQSVVLSSCPRWPTGVNHFDWPNVGPLTDVLVGPTLAHRLNPFWTN